MAAPPTPIGLTEEDHKVINRLTGWNIGIGIAALSIGLWLGVLQGLEHVGLNLYRYLAPGIQTYYWTFYLGLTLVVVGSWTVGYGLYFTYGAWRRERRILVNGRRFWRWAR